MKIDYKKIINIKTKKNLNEFLLNKPIFYNNYLFHYLIELNNIDALKLHHFPIYLENSDGLNGFHIASKYNNIEILEYLIETYPEYIYNRNKNNETFIKYLEVQIIPQLIKKYPKLNWDDLIIYGTQIANELLIIILLNLKYDKLKQLLNVYNIKPNNTNCYLHAIVKSNLLTSIEKIKILNQYSNEDINIKSGYDGNGLIMVALNNDDDKLINYLIDRNIDLDYYTFLETNSPLSIALFYDIINNTNKYSNKIFNKIKDKNPKFLESFDTKLNSYLHTCLFIIQNKNKTYPKMEILKYYSSNIWNQTNIDKISPLEIIIDLDYDTYSNIIDNKISIKPEIINKIKNKNNPYYKKWLELFEKQKKYKDEENDIILETYKYSHYTIFQSKFKDVGIFILYLGDKYKELLIPNIQSYMIKNLTLDNASTFSDELIIKENIFPWIISYNSNTEYHIHPYLNNIINNEINKNKKRFGIVFLSIINPNLLHANVLIYDFKKLTVERFEPYGNTSIVDNEIDDLLEEELTWSTGLTYKRPKDYLPYAGFQTISDENNIMNSKSGDFGGFCLAWCLWYIEIRLKNPDVEPNILIMKIVNKLNKLNYKFIEYIRNYSTKINDKRVSYIKKIGIDEKNISDSYLNNNDNILLTNYLIKKFNDF